MPLKTYSNPASKDSLFAYADSDPLMKRMLTDQPDDNDADDQQQLERQRLMSSPEFKALKKQMRVRHADGTTGPASDEFILQQVMARRAVAARKKGSQPEEDQQ